MNISESEFYFARPDEIAIKAAIEWTIPSTHDVLFSGLLPADATAYFYVIVSLHQRQWIPHYIGKIYAQCSSQRHRAADHVERLRDLQERYPNRTFHLSLGTPTFTGIPGDPDPQTIDDLEGLLIYSNWNEDMVNKRKIDSFVCSRQIYLENTGFNQHLWKRAAYGVFSSWE
jgi:hypothetical protein